jgi:hypothetical protein
MRGNVKTSHGINDRRTILSALQKFIRRGETMRALHIAIDVVCLQMSTISNPTNLKAFVSNVRNRLMICAVEDCLHPSIYLLVSQLAKDFEEGRTSAKGIRSFLRIVVILSRSRKGRMPSVLKILQKNASSSFDEEFCDRYKNILSSSENSVGFKVFCTEFADGKISCVRHLDTSTKDGQIEAWKFLGSIKDVDGLQGCIRGLRAIQYDIIPKDHREGYLVLLQAVSIALFRHNVEKWDHKDVPVTTDVIHDSNAQLLDLFRERLLDKTPTDIPDYVLDMHTSKGRGMKRGSTHFANVGSLVTNMAVDVVPPEMMDEFVQMYKDSKAHEKHDP